MRNLGARLIELGATEPEPLTAQRGRMLLVASIAVAVTRLFAVSRSLWDWDESLFCSAVRDYDVTQHHPHPPGFPLFIVMAKVVRLFLDSEFHALQVVVLLAAIALFPLLVALFLELRLSFATAMSAAGLFVFFPPVWFYGGTAFSDVPAVVLAIAAVWALLRGMRSTRWFFGGVLLLGIAAGVRPQNLLIGFVPLAIASLLRGRRSLWTPIAGALMLALVIVASYGGAAIASGGWEAYAHSVEAHSQYIRKVDSFRSLSRPPLRSLVDEYFVEAYAAGSVNYLLTLLVVLGIAHSARNQRWALFLMLASFGAFVFFAWLMLDLHSVTRFSIAYLPFFALMAAAGIEMSCRAASSVWKPRIQAIATSLLIALLVARAAPALVVARSTLSPPVAAIEWVKANLDVGKTRLLVDFSLSPQATCLLSDRPFQIVQIDQGLPASLTSRPAWLLAEGLTTAADGLTFARPRGRLWTIARHRYFQVSIRPASSSPKFGEGWYEPEQDETRAWRWMGSSSLTELPPLEGPCRLALSMEVPVGVFESPPAVTIELEGSELDRIRPEAGRIERAWELDCIAGETPLLRIATDRTVIPAEVGPSEDTRRLGVRMNGLSWTAAE